MTTPPAVSPAVSPAAIAGADWLAWPQTRAVFAALCAEGGTARAVGGAVRDTLLGRPVVEIDIATPAPPKRVMALAVAAGLKTVPTGIAHGTVTVIAAGKPFEVTTLRKDVATFGRHAEVAFTDDWEADARRRDFTINALYADADGNLYDPLGGRADIDARRVAFIGEARARVREDYLRILRFFRFNAEYAAPPYDAAGLAACVAERGGLGRLSPERVRAELLRLLVAPGATHALDAMFDYGLLVEVLGGAPHLARLARLMRLQMTPDPMLRLAALAVMVPEDADRLRDRLRLSNADHARLEAAAGYRALAGADQSQARAVLYRRGADAYRDQALLAWAAASGDAAEEDWRDLHALPERWAPPAFPIRGRDLIALGAAEGAAVGALLAELETAWIAGGYKDDKDRLLAKARQMLGGMPGTREN